MHLLLDRDGYWHCNNKFFMLFQTVTSITKFYKLWPKIYYRWFLGRGGYYHFPRIITRASFLSCPRRWRVLPYIYNIVFLCVFDNLYSTWNRILNGLELIFFKNLLESLNDLSSVLLPHSFITSKGTSDYSLFG
jgi:hypothetical protein